MQVISIFTGSVVARDLDEVAGYRKANAAIELFVVRPATPLIGQPPIT